MKTSTLSTWRSLAMVLLLAAVPGMLLAGSEFSAEMLQRGPQGEISSGKMFVGDKRVRTEMSHQGRQVIRINDENRGVEWILFPDEKKYMEQPLGGAGQPGPGEGARSAADPCAGVPGLRCQKLGEEEIGGRKAVKWEMVASRQGQTITSTQWIDEERGVPLRQEMPNGQTTELKFVAMEDLEGRRVEKWEMVVTNPNQPETRTFQWFDPELELAVRQEFPGGMVSEIRNIRVGKQPDELFKIPAGFERISAPQNLPEGAEGSGDGP